MTLGELLGEKRDARDAYDQLIEFGYPIDERGIDLARTLERHIVALEEAIDQHSESSWRRLEVTEGARLR